MKYLRLFSRNGDKVSSRKKSVKTWCEILKLIFKEWSWSKFSKEFFKTLCEIFTFIFKEWRSSQFSKETGEQHTAQLVFEVSLYSSVRFDRHLQYVRAWNSFIFAVIKGAISRNSKLVGQKVWSEIDLNHYGKMG